MNSDNISKLANRIALKNPDGASKLHEITNLANTLNEIRVSLFNSIDLENKIQYEKRSGASYRKLRAMRASKNAIIDNGIKLMSAVNKKANEYDTKYIFTEHLKFFSFSKRNGFLKDASEYENLVLDNVIRNSFVQSNPDIYSSYNDKKYLLSLIIGFEINERVLEIEKDDKNIADNDKENKINCKEEHKITRLKTVDNLINNAKEQKEEDEKSKETEHIKDNKNFKNNGKQHDEKKPGDDGPGL